MSQKWSFSIGSLHSLTKFSNDVLTVFFKLLKLHYVKHNWEIIENSRIIFPCVFIKQNGGNYTLICFSLHVYFNYDTKKTPKTQLFYQSNGKPNLNECNGSIAWKIHKLLRKNRNKLKMWKKGLFIDFINYLFVVWFCLSCCLSSNIYY